MLVQVWLVASGRPPSYPVPDRRRGARRDPARGGRVEAKASTRASRGHSAAFLRRRCRASPCRGASTELAAQDDAASAFSAPTRRCTAPRAAARDSCVGSGRRESLAQTGALPEAGKTPRKNVREEGPQRAGALQKTTPRATRSMRRRTAALRRSFASCGSFARMAALLAPQSRGRERWEADIALAADLLERRSSSGLGARTSRTASARRARSRSRGSA